MESFFNINSNITQHALMKTLRTIKFAAPLAAAALAFAFFSSGCSHSVAPVRSGFFPSSVSLNSGNPYDTLGQDHNIELEWAMSHTDSTSAEGTDTIAYKESIVDTVMKPYLASKYGATSAEVDSFVTLAINARSLKQPLYFDTISTATGLTSHEVSYFNRFGNAMGIAETNGGDFMDSILAIENSIVNDTWAPGENQAQKMISVAKWSCELWTNDASSLWKARFGITPPGDTIPEHTGGAILADANASDWGPIGVFLATLFYSEPAR